MIVDRPLVEPSWPEGGFTTRRFPERNWSIQQFTGYPVSNVQAGQWARGGIVRLYQPAFRPPMLGLNAYDPTDPNSWGTPAEA